MRVARRLKVREPDPCREQRQVTDLDELGIELGPGPLDVDENIVRPIVRALERFSQVLDALPFGHGPETDPPVILPLARRDMKERRLPTDASVSMSATRLDGLRSRAALASDKSAVVFPAPPFGVPKVICMRSPYFKFRSCNESAKSHLI